MDEKAPATERSEIDPGDSEDSPAPSMVVASTIYPSTLPIIALPNRPLFPKTVTPLTIGSPKLVRLLQPILKMQQPLIGVVLKRGDSSEEQTRGGDAEQSIRPSGPDDLHDVGTIARSSRLKERKTACRFWLEASTASESTGS